MTRSRTPWLLSAAALAVVTTLASMRARGSEAADTPTLATRPGMDLTDLYVFPSPANANNVVLVMNVHPFLQSGQVPGTIFDPNVLFQFKIDNTGDNVEDLVIQAQFTGTDTNQVVQIAGPVHPSHIGAVTVKEPVDSVSGKLNTPFTLSNGIKAIAGAREDPFFFDLAQFFTLLPDRANPLNGPTFTNTSGQSVSTTPADPNHLQANAFRPAGQDFFKSLNVMSIVLEVPKNMLTGGGNGKIGVWATTSI